MSLTSEESSFPIEPMARGWALVDGNETICMYSSVELAKMHASDYRKYFALEPDFPVVVEYVRADSVPTQDELDSLRLEVNKLKCLLAVRTLKEDALGEASPRVTLAEMEGVTAAFKEIERIQADMDARKSNYEKPPAVNFRFHPEDQERICSDGRWYVRQGSRMVNVVDPSDWYEPKP